MNALDQLKQWTTVVADTGDFALMRAYQPEDATTNPSLMLNLAKSDAGKKLLNTAIERVAKESGGKQKDDAAWVTRVAELAVVLVGCEILKVVPGLVSIEVDAAFSHDADKSVECAKRYIQLFEQEGFKRERILIKLATTWAGCRAAETLLKERIRCNMTLVFSLVQAAAAADAGAFLISPFVGRVLDWYKKREPTKDYSGEKDPGVQRVKEIYRYFKKHNLSTTVMAASFRSVDEIKCLAGCERVTIAPALLQQLQNDTESKLERVLSPESAGDAPERLTLDAAKFDELLASDAMAAEKLSEGIENFRQDGLRLTRLIVEMC